MAAASSHAVSPAQAALACACPRCGKGRLFRGFLTVIERCDHCGLELAKHDSGDGPAVLLIFVLAAPAFGIAVWLGMAYDLPSWLPALIAGIFTVAAALLLLRPSKALFMALQYRHRREDFEGGG
jgi:uncharacterized protein (DUF983 family)